MNAAAKLRINMAAVKTVATLVVQTQVIIMEILVMEVAKAALDMIKSKIT